MIDHDQLIKSLIRHFFKDYLELFFPDLAARLHLDSPEFPVTFLDKEHFTDIPRGRRRDVDVLARVWTRDETFETILVHSEHQEQDRQDPDEAVMPFVERMFYYSLLLQLRHQREHIIPLVLWFVPGKGGVGLEIFDNRALGAGLRLDYYRVCVPDLEAEEYLRKDNPLAHGLAARMRRGDLSPVRLSLACRSRIVRAPISDVKKMVLLDLVDTYVKLNEKEVEEMRSHLEKDREFEDIKRSDLTYYGQIQYDAFAEGLAKGKADGEARGEAKGEAKALLQLLSVRLGKIPPEARQIVLAQAESSPETISAWLGEAVQALDADAAGRLLRKILAP